MMDKLYELQTLYHHEKASQEIRNQNVVDFMKRPKWKCNNNITPSSSVKRIDGDSIN